MGIKAPRESGLTRAVLQYLTLRGIVCWRNNTGALKVQNRFARFGAPGAADVLGLLPGGRLLAVEVKRPGGKTTGLQRAWLDMVGRAGALALVVISVDDLARQLGEAGY